MMRTQDRIQRMTFGLLTLGCTACYTGVSTPAALDTDGGDETGGADVGEEGGAPNTGGTAGGDTDDDGPGAVDEQGLPTATPLRLDAQGYSETVVSLFEGRAADADVEPGFMPDIAVPFAWVNPIDRFSTRASSYRVNNEDFARVVRNAEDVAELYIDDVADAQCLDETADWAGCHRAVLAEAAELLYRRPATDEELDELLALEPAIESPVPRDRLALSLRAMLTNANFLLRVEVGEPADDGVRALDPFELASALSFTLSGGPPDAPLYAAAKDGSLADSAVYEQHVERLLAGRAHRLRVRRFLREFWQYEVASEVARDVRPEDVIPEDVPGASNARYKPALLVEETDALIDHLVETSLETDFLATMLTTTDGFVQDESAIFYNQESDAEEPAFTTFAAAERQGILMQPSWLVAFSEPDHNSPIRRGLFIQESLLCGDVPDIPIEGVPLLELSEDETLRESLALHLEGDGSCVGCHQAMDPLALPLEQFDLFGRHRTMEAGKPVVTTGNILSLGGPFEGEGDVADPFELVARLADARHVTRCFLEHAFLFWMGRAVDVHDEPVIDAATDAYIEEGGNFNAALRVFVTADVFKHRQGVEQ